VKSGSAQPHHSQLLIFFLSLRSLTKRSLHCATNAQRCCDLANWCSEVVAVMTTDSGMIDNKNNGSTISKSRVFESLCDTINYARFLITANLWINCIAALSAIAVPDLNTLATDSQTLLSSPGTPASQSSPRVPSHPYTQRSRYHRRMLLDITPRH